MKCPICDGKLKGDWPDKHKFFNCEKCNQRFYVTNGEYHSMPDDSVYWDEDGNVHEVEKNYGKCEECSKSLKGSVFVAPWEEGSNANGFVRCKYCGHENIKYGCGED